MLSNINSTGILTASQIRFGSIGAITDLNSDMRQANTLTFGGGEMAMFTRFNGGNNYSQILVDNYPLYIGTQGEQGGQTYYTSLLSVNPGNDSGTFGTNDAYISLGHGQTVSNGSGGNVLTRLKTTATGTTGYGNLDLLSGDISVSGVVTATSFTGSGAGLTSIPAAQLTGSLPAINGSNLIGVIASGTGIEIKDSDSVVGSAGTVNFGDGLAVSPVSAGVVTVTASGGSLQSRTIVSASTTSITDNAVGFTTAAGFKAYTLMKVGVSTAAWIRIYTDSTSRTNDSSRSVGEDPSPGSGVIAEVVTTGISTQQVITPFAMGGNMDDPVSNVIYLAIKNLSGSTQTITANLTILQLEAQ